MCLNFLLNYDKLFFNIMYKKYILMKNKRINLLLKSDKKENYWWKQDILYFFTYFETL